MTRSGQTLYPGGEPYGSELAWAGWLIDPAADAAWPADTIDYGAAIGMLKYMAFAKNPPASFKLTDWKFTLDNYQRLTALNGLNDATDPNLSAFAQAGGKIIIWQGGPTPRSARSARSTYYSAVVQAAGGYAARPAVLPALHGPRRLPLPRRGRPAGHRRPARLR